jgi:hypothetical protein
MSKLNKKSIALKRKYIETKKSMSCESNFDEVVNLMNISKKEVDLLKSTLDISKNLCSYDESHGFDKHYAGIDGGKKYFDSGCRGGKFISASNYNSIESLDLKEVEHLDLSDLEKAVLEGFVKSSNKLGINSVAKTLVNPKTGRPFTRMAVTYAWRRIKTKISKFKEAA